MSNRQEPLPFDEAVGLAQDFMDEMGISALARESTYGDQVLGERSVNYLLSDQVNLDLNYDSLGKYLEIEYTAILHKLKDLALGIYLIGSKGYDVDEGTGLIELLYGGLADFLEKRFQQTSDLEFKTRTYAHEEMGVELTVTIPKELLQQNETRKKAAEGLAEIHNEVIKYLSS